MLSLLGLVAGCGTWLQLPKDNDRPAFIHDSYKSEDFDRVAQNLVYAFSQLEKASPLRTTIQMIEPATPFATALAQRFQDAGYGYQQVTGDTGLNFVSFKAENFENEFGYHTLFRMAVGEVSLEREYRKIDGFLTPVSAMRVFGSSVEDVNLNDDIFRWENPNEFISEVIVSIEEEPLIKEFTPVIIAQNEISSPGTQSQDDIQQSVENSADAVDGAPDTFAMRVRNNVFETGQSNFAQYLSGYRDVESKVLVFPNDSLRLGQRNKEYLNNLANSFRAETDIVHVLGCSHGRTNINNGNARLAIGRTNRVKENLIVAGIDPKFIYDESCWGKEYWDEAVPRRGVVIKRKRRIN